MANHAKPVARGAKPSATRAEAGDRRRKRRREGPAAETPAEAPAALQAKLQVGAPDDEYEREADALADRVMKMPPRRARKGGASSSSSGGAGTDEARRVPLPASEEEETAQTDAMPEAEEETAQAAAMPEEEAEEAEEETAQAASMPEADSEEETAQRAATPETESEEETAQRAATPEAESEEETAQAASMPETEAEEEDTAQRAATPEAESEEETAQAASMPETEAEDTGQRAATPEADAEEEETAQRATTSEPDDEEVQRRPTRRRGPRITPRFESTLRRLRQTGGQRLPPSLRQFMESRFGLDLAHVRIHVGDTAQGLAKTMRARAFTVGRDIVFGAGEYRPHAAPGRRLIAHELTHVLQQRGGLHSVQREVRPGIERPKRPSLRSLLDLFELKRGVPRAVLGIVVELIERALARGVEAQALAALTSDAVEAATTSRTILSLTHRLELESTWTGSGRQLRWTLVDATNDRPIFARAHERGDESTDVAALRPRDDVTISVATPVGTNAEQASDQRYSSSEPTSPDVEPDARPTESRAAVESGRSRADDRADPTPTPPESEALAAVDEVAPVEEEPTSSAGHGDTAGTDDPALARHPVDEAKDDDVPEEEPVPTDEAPVQRASEPGAPRDGMRLSARTQRDFHAVTATPGRALPTDVRRFMEARFSASFEHVRVHDDARSGRVARALGARAFTRGHDVVFAPGRFSPHTPDGLRLLAHELSHVLQQREGGPAAIQRDAEECPPVEEVPEVEVVHSPTSPGEDSSFIATRNRVDDRAENQAQHGEGEDKSTNANAAAEVKEGEEQSHAQKDQVGKMDAQAQSPPAFDKEAFIEKVLAEVEKIAPAVLDDVFKFKQRNKAGEVKSAVTSEVDAAQDKSQGPLEDASTEEPGPGTSPRTPGSLEIEPPGEEPGSVRADRAMPPPKTDSEFDLRPDAVRTENILKEACITREFMDEHGDPELKDAAAAQDELTAATDEAPQEYREGEAATLEQARADASAKGKEGVAGLFGERAGKFGEVGTTQQQTKTENEAKRDAASIAIDGVFESTQSKVTTRLAKIGTDGDTTFTSDADAAVTKFERFIDTNAEAHKKEWYETALEWLEDALFDEPPPEVWDFYAEGRATFVADLRTAIGKVADLVDEGLKDARKLVEEGKAAVQKELDKLGGDLEDFKQKKSEEMNDKFRGLEAEIKKKEAQIVTGLAKRYVKALETAKSIEDAVREKYKNVLEKAEDAYVAVRDAVLGWIEKLSTIVGGVAKKIMHDPGQFLSNLGEGIVQGLTMFMDDIGENIKGAVVQWLTGNLGSAGIALPATFDAKGIIGFLLELVGLGISSIKDIARKELGEAVVSAIERGVEGAEEIKRIFDVLVNEGPAGLFTFLATEFEEMKEKILGEAGEALAEALVIAGIKKVLGIISGLVSGGVGTVVTIVATIIDVVLWFRDNAAQLAELVSTVAGLANAIFMGQVDALANAVNGLLKRLLPVVLGFVGALVGIDKAIKKIQKVFKAIKKPATKAITKLFRKFKKLAKGLLKKIKGKKGKGKGKGKGKDKFLKPAEVRKKIKRALRKPTKAKDPAAAIAETRSLAESLRATYQPRLEKAKIKINILDASPNGVEKDGDIDMTVALSPSEPVSRPVEKGGLPKTLQRAHDKLRPRKAEIDKLWSQRNIAKALAADPAKKAGLEAEKAAVVTAVESALSGADEAEYQQLKSGKGPGPDRLQALYDGLHARANKLGEALRSLQDPADRLKMGMQAAVRAVNRFAGKPISSEKLTPLFAAIVTKYGFKSLDVKPQGSRWAVEGEVNPRGTSVTDALIPHTTDDQRPIIDNYTKWLGKYRTAIDQIRAMAVAKEKPGKIYKTAESLYRAPQKHLHEIEVAVNTSSDTHLQMLIKSLFAQRPLLDVDAEAAKTGGVASTDTGLTVQCEAVRRAASLAGATVAGVKSALGKPKEERHAAEDGAHAFTWIFGDKSSIRLDIPGLRNDNDWQVNRDPHLAVYGPKGEVLSQLGIAVPGASEPAHLRIFKGGDEANDEGKGKSKGKGKGKGKG